MSGRLRIKICGVTHQEHVLAAAEAGADLVGLVLWPHSPRHVAFDQALALAATAGEKRLERVALVVDPDDAELDRIAHHAASFDRVQFHGSESCQRLERSPRTSIKGFAFDPERLAHWDACPHAEWLLIDGPRGGGGMPFDHRLLETAAERPRKPWLIAGGLTPDSVAAVVASTRPFGVDVSSGVERSRGVKEPALIAAFCAAARQA